MVPKVVQVHPYTTHSEVPVVDEDFLEKVRYWAGMEEGEVESEAFTISFRNILRLSDYIGSNQLHLSCQNLIQMVCLRAEKRVMKRLLMRWPDLFESREYSEMVKSIAGEHSELVEEELKNTKLTREVLLSWLNEEHISGAVGKTTIERSRKSGRSLQEELSSLRIPPDSKLGKRCLEEFYLYCQREDYLKISDSELYRILARWQLPVIRAFLKNILEVSETTDFQRLYKCGVYLRDAFTGTTNSPQCHSFFTGFSDKLILRYNCWLGYLTIVEGFGQDTNDNRLKFWKDYVPNCTQVYIQKFSEALIMYYAHYCIVEFTTKTKGPIYIYERTYFEQSIEPLTRKLKNSNLRKELFRQVEVFPKSAKRISHNSGWEYKVRDYLRRYNIV
jgi:hypothetical protein